MDCPSSGSQLSFGLFLSESVVHDVGMCLNNSNNLALTISSFILFRCCVLVRIFLIAFLGLKC